VPVLDFDFGVSSSVLSPFLFRLYLDDLSSPLRYVAVCLMFSSLITFL